MATHNELGKKGEQIARSYLEEKGYRILEINWRFKQTEIDLIVMKDGVLVFVEVKTRAGDYYGYPEDAVSRKKQIALQRASAAYIHLHRYERELRFDIISITFGAGDAYDLYHIEDAFFPGL